MDNTKQALAYPRPSSIRDFDRWTLLGYVALALLALAVAVAASQGPSIPDPSFVTETVMP